MSIEKAAKQFINSVIYTHANGIVMSGPFKGMRLLEEISWDDGNLGSKVLGCYEQELHQVIEEEITRLEKLYTDRGPPVILDIGCSEGYYAVGMARRLVDTKPSITVVDSSEDALRITHAAAEYNGVEIFQATTVLFGKDFNTGYRPDLVICDCEGGEIDYLDLEKFPGLQTAVIIVECHDTTQILVDRFAKTHEIWVVYEGARNPNQFEFLQRMDSLMRWLAVSEGRPCTMHWLLMRPRIQTSEPQ
jgi:hypothetical protein